MRDQAFSVSQVNEYVRMLLDGNAVLKNIWVRGEISNFTNHYRTGHLYFSLKDEGGLIRAVMFRGDAAELSFVPEDGMKVLVHGRVSAYVRDGQYQLYVQSMEPDGVGSLAVAFEQLKRKLEAEGLFDASRKKALPPCPHTVGLVTSPTGAAVRDMIRVAARRYPSARLLIYPAQVQGDTAATYLAGGIRYFNRMKDDPEQGVDVIVIGRGGGSMEDLWAFNDEVLARTVAASELPVISAVGHEVDFTICDFVADVRAATPSAALEIALPNRAELKKRLIQQNDRLTASLTYGLRQRRERLGRVSDARVLRSPLAPYTERRLTLDRLSQSMDAAMARRTESLKRDVGQVAGRLNALSPLGVLSRGYALAQTEDGRVIGSVDDVSVQDTVTVRLRDGRVTARVQSVEKTEIGERADGNG